MGYGVFIFTQDFKGVSVFGVIHIDYNPIGNSGVQSFYILKYLF